MKQYLMYLRKSRADRDFSDEPVLQTLMRHKKRLDEFCLSHDIIVPEGNVLYEVAGADSIASRPKMMELLSMVESGDYEAVLCIDMDRLSRGSGADQALVINTFKYSRTKIITPSKSYDFNNETDEQFAELGLFIGRNEYRMIKKRLRQGKIDAVKEGKYPAGVPPYGYKTYKLKGQKGFSLEVVPEEAEIVRLIFRLYTEENMGGHKIASWLNQHGYRARQGKEWLAAHVNVIVSNPTYIGKVRYGHRTTINEIRNGEIVQVERNNDENQLICEGIHEPIITEEVFKIAEQIRKNHFKPHTRIAYETQNSLCGLVKCSRCGRTLILRSHDGIGRALYCPTPGCGTKSSYLDAVEERLLEFLRDWLSGYEHYEDEKEKTADITKQLEKSVKKVQQSLETEKKKQKRIYDLMEDNVYTVEEYKVRMVESKKRIGVLEASLSAETAKLDMAKAAEAQKASIAPIVKDAVDVYKALPNATEKNKWMKMVFAEIIYTKTVGGKGHRNDFDLEVFPRIPKA